jgi:hypothetical protein
VQLYSSFVSQCSEFCRHKHLCCSPTSVYCCKRIFRYRLSPETFGYTLVHPCKKAGFESTITAFERSKIVRPLGSGLEEAKGPYLFWICRIPDGYLLMVVQKRRTVVYQLRAEGRLLGSTSGVVGSQYHCSSTPQDLHLRRTFSAKLNSHSSLFLIAHTFSGTIQLLPVQNTQSLGNTVQTS